MAFELSGYLKRIDCLHIPVTAEGLATLQQAQMRAIAFENIDVLLGETPALDQDALWDKLITRRRGGYCLELNALFGQALEALGFAARPVLARVRMGAPCGGPRTHHAWVVTIGDTDYLADTGFGGPASNSPLLLEDDFLQQNGAGLFRIRYDHESGERVVERADGDGWFALYGFDEARVEFSDLTAANVVCSRWEGSPFPTNLMMTRLVGDERVSLFNRSLKTLAEGQVETRVVGSEAELAMVLRNAFGLQLAGEFVSRLWWRIQAEDNGRSEAAA